MQRIKASFAVGLNCPVSMELIVLRETPTSCASCAWESPFSVRMSFNLFFRVSRSSTVSPPYKSRNVHRQEHQRKAYFDQTANQFVPFL